MNLEFHAYAMVEPEGAALVAGCVVGAIAVALAVGPAVLHWWRRR